MVVERAGAFLEATFQHKTKYGSNHAGRAAQSKEENAHAARGKSMANGIQRMLLRMRGLRMDQEARSTGSSDEYSRNNFPKQR